MKRLGVFLFAAALPMLALADDHGWHVLCVAHNGTVSVLSSLTRVQAEFIHDRLLGLPATPDEKRKAADLKRERDAAEAA